MKDLGAETHEDVKGKFYEGEESMNKELEDYMYRKMIIEEYGEASFKWAENNYKKKIKFNKMGFWKRLSVGWEINRFGSDRFWEMKKHQAEYIGNIIKAKKTLLHGKVHQGEKDDN